MTLPSIKSSSPAPPELTPACFYLYCTASAQSLTRSDVSDIFHSYADRPIVAKNSAPHSGAVAWVRGLVERIEVRGPVQRIGFMVGQTCRLH
eukprot:1161047-Pelagomonas_calceolata.AAC.12